MLQEFVQSVVNTCRSELSGIHTAFPGTVTAFDAATGLATVKPALQYKTPSGGKLDYPAISGVPVVIPQAMGQQAAIAFPVKAGDGCLVVIAEQSIETWLYGQETATDLAFDLSNAICIPGLFSKANTALARACQKNAVVVDVKGTSLTVSSGVVEINAATTRITGNVVVNGDVNANGVSLAKHTHTGYYGVTTSGPK